MAEPIASTQQQIVDFGLSHRLAGISEEVFNYAQQVLQAMSVERKMDALNAFDAVPRRLRPLLVRVLRWYPHVVSRLLEDFPTTLRTVYQGLRAVKLCRPGVPRDEGDADEMASSLRTDVLRERRNRSAVTRFVQARMPLQVCHVVPYALGRHHDRGSLPFFRLVGLVFPFYSAHVWNNAGSLNVHNRRNLVIFDPNTHAMMDDGLFFLQPTLHELTTLMYTVRFKYVSEPWRYTAVIAGVAVELRDGHEIRSDVDLCGEGVLHHVMNSFRILGSLYVFGEGADGQLRDLGPFG